MTFIIAPSTATPTLFNSPSFLATMQAGKWRTSFVLNHSSTQALAGGSLEWVPVISFDDGNNGALYFHFAQLAISRSADGVDMVSANLTWNAGTLLTVTVDVPKAQLTVSGALTGDGTNTGTAWTWTGSNIYYGRDAAAGVLNGTMNGVEDFNPDYVARGTVQPLSVGGPGRLGRSPSPSSRLIVVLGTSLLTPPAIASPGVPQDVSPTGIDSAEAFGTLTATVGAMTWMQALPQPLSAGMATRIPAPPPPTLGTGISQTTASGSAQSVSPTGIDSAEAFGTLTVSQGQVVAPTGIASAEAFGTFTARTQQVVAPTGISSAEAFGTLTARTQQIVQPTGIASAEQFGTAVVTVTNRVYPAGIVSAEQFGTLRVTGGSRRRGGTMTDFISVQISYTGSTPGADSSTYPLFNSYTAANGAGNFFAGAGINVFHLQMDHNQAGTLNEYMSNDGSSWTQVSTEAIAAPATSASTQRSFDVSSYRFWKLDWVNGGTAQTIWNPAMSGAAV